MKATPIALENMTQMSKIIRGIALHRVEVTSIMHLILKTFWHLLRRIFKSNGGCFPDDDTQNSNFVTGARIAVLLCTETTQKIDRGGAEVDF